jgi:hypothetical protein
MYTFLNSSTPMDLLLHLHLGLRTPTYTVPSSLLWHEMSGIAPRPLAVPQAAVMLGVSVKHRKVVKYAPTFFSKFYWVIVSPCNFKLGQESKDQEWRATHLSGTPGVKSVEFPTPVFLSQSRRCCIRGVWVLRSSDIVYTLRNTTPGPPIFSVLKHRVIK